MPERSEMTVPAPGPVMERAYLPIGDHVGPRLEVRQDSTRLPLTGHAPSTHMPWRVVTDGDDFVRGARGEIKKLPSQPCCSVAGCGSVRSRH
jgi:hypothetical protein